MRDKKHTIPQRASDSWILDHIGEILVGAVGALVTGIISVWNKLIDSKVKAVETDGAATKVDVTKLYESADRTNARLSTLEANHQGLREIALERDARTNARLDEISRKIDVLLNRVSGE